VHLVKTIFVITLLTMTLHASYERYCNARFGFCVDVKRSWGKEPAPANNDGRSFFDNEGFKMSVYGSYNALDQNLRAHQEGYRSELDQITYQPIKHNWYVLSGYKGSEIIYIKTFLNNKTFYTLYIRYPKALQGRYNPIVSRLSKSFNATGR